MLDISYYKKQILKYLGYTIFTFIFGFIYENFSHKVYSNYMMYAYLIPLLMGLVVVSIFYLLKIKLPNDKTRSLYKASIFTFTLGSLVKGALDIYGTTNRLINVYFDVGLILLGISIIIYLYQILISK